MVTKQPFGTTKDGAPVTAYTIANGRGISVTVLDYGATLQSVVLPCKGEKTDILLGYDSIAEYERNDGYLGASIGRYAGRVPDSVLQIGNDAFPVSANEGKNHLHGGFRGFDKRIWRAEAGFDAVTFTLRSEDGEEGYPGTLLCTAAFTLSRDALSIRYRGEADRDTAWNPTNHAYWNLNGHDAGDTRKHLLEIPADRYVPVGPDMIPTDGEEDVSGTRFDFRSLREIGDTYDNSFVLRGSPIRLWGNRNIGMEIRTTCTSVQLYNAKFLGDRSGKGGAHYSPYGAVCLETEGRQALRGVPIAEENVLARSRSGQERITKYRFIIQED
ncbi:MAG: galactose mutarotase [Clostridia bacterium]|nr:galactose mutarotase [Clostridia bacterium]